MDAKIDIKVDENLDVPIYRQVAGAITGEIKKGHLEYGMQLPTVRQLAAQLNIARGTIKRAYDDLESSGVISKTRGKGTFVSWQEETIQSRKDKAMEAIDHMLDLMEGMRFSPTEINIFLDLKMRERLQRETLVSV
ncbi:MAG: GntR family transcriptional regulator, partial [Firmicutes bacterium]|nr:GntR family transcriptional regulator [Bacillota bacterium]